MLVFTFRNQHRAAVEGTEQTVALFCTGNTKQGLEQEQGKKKGKKEQTSGSRQERGRPETRPVNHSHRFSLQIPISEEQKRRHRPTEGPRLNLYSSTINGWLLFPEVCSSHRLTFPQALQNTPEPDSFPPWWH